MKLLKTLVRESWVCNTFNKILILKKEKKAEYMVYVRSLIGQDVSNRHLQTEVCYLWQQM